MLNSASDYKYQSVGGWNVSRRPVWGTSPMEAPLHYGDMLYLAESFLVSQAARAGNGSSRPQSILPSGSDLPIVSSSPSAGDKTPTYLLKAIHDLYTTAEGSSSLNNQFVKVDGTIPDRLRVNDIVSSAAFVNAIRLPALDANTDWTYPTSSGETVLNIRPYLKSFDALAKLRRLVRASVASNQTSSVAYEYDRVTSQLVDDEWQSSTYHYAGRSSSFFSSSEHSESGDGSKITGKVEQSSQFNVSLSKEDFWNTLAIKSVLIRVEGYTRISRYSQTTATPMWIVHPVNVTSSTPSFSLSLSSDDAAGYAGSLGVNTSSKYGWGVTITPTYFDLVFNYKHLI